jgi:hypothetical protein
MNEYIIDDHAGWTVTPANDNRESKIAQFSQWIRGEELHKKESVVWVKIFNSMTDSRQRRMNQ